jgi:hypothetical protein
MPIPIQCFACTPPTNWETEAEYNDHLVTFHGTSSPDEAMKLERAKRANTPVDLPPGIPPEAAPTPEFTKTMQEIERAKVSQATPPPPAQNIPVPQIEPITLKYRYEGMHSCGNKVNTLELDADGKHFVVCYCLICQTQVEIREVADLKNVDTNEERIQIDDKKYVLEKKKKEVKNG